MSPEQEDYLRSRPPGEAVIFALRKLLTIDRRLLEIDANERSITFRFAMHLQSQLQDWEIDCEFNRDGVEPKKLGHLELYPDGEDEEAKTVFPDVIAHRRGSKDNFLVVEFKKSTGNVDPNIDRRKLLGYKRQLGYMHALFIVVGTGGQANIGVLEWI
ncbi:hypothetical protein QMA78_00015 [Burkholderia pseudomallei]|uniref:hypothetical protein n=1 Tax=Burkholderia pseudomallei TaxID=28450 RepID=UPI002DB7F7F6|nr:hypothetical protein [Burkholderia pseudomallei]MEB5488943.1 hypothetical protein [Burkholderia pseudomallei]